MRGPRFQCPIFLIDKNYAFNSYSIKSFAYIHIRTFAHLPLLHICASIRTFAHVHICTSNK